MKQGNKRMDGNERLCEPTVFTVAAYKRFFAFALVRGVCGVEPLENTLAAAPTRIAGTWTRLRCDKHKHNTTLLVNIVSYYCVQY